MNKITEKSLCMFFNMFWMVSSLPGAIRFLTASFFPSQIQKKLMRKHLRTNSKTHFGQRHNFGSIHDYSLFSELPVTEFDDYDHDLKEGFATYCSDRVILMEPTSGTSSFTKLIPYTEELKSQFKRAISPWIFSLFFNHPRILSGVQYWSISPNTENEDKDFNEGFQGDSEYLGFLGNFISEFILAVPNDVRRIKDPDNFEYVTMLYLCRKENLRLISVWHPSFLTILIDSLNKNFQNIIRDINSGTITPPNPLKDQDTIKSLSDNLKPFLKRGTDLKNIGQLPDNISMIWPNLEIISCWGGKNSDHWLRKMRKWFPGTLIQEKGLIATEYIASFPVRKSAEKVLAVNSHFFEFKHIESEKIYLPHELEIGKEYSLIVTTGNGFTRYNTHDIIKVTGYYNQLPLFEFIGRDNHTSDICGEKVSQHHAESIISELDLDYNFAMIAAEKKNDQIFYCLFIKCDSDSNIMELDKLLEDRLKENFHYHHARNLGQLLDAKSFLITGPADKKYHERMISSGMKAGDIKVPILSTELNWSEFFEGSFTYHPCSHHIAGKPC